MNVKIGEKIKALRKRDDITQERLAEVLGVTNQAVSKWESGNSYPDIEYISPIANFFNITIDYLFDHDTAEKRRKVEEYCAQYGKLRKENIQPHHKQIDLMRQALAEFPAEEKLLINLAISLFFKWCAYRKWGTDSGEPDFEKHKSFDSWEESMKIMEELLASSADDFIRSECRRFLASIYGGIGEKKKLMALAEKCDTLSSCKEVILATSLWGEDHIEAKQKYLDGLVFSLMHELFRSGNYFDVDMETKKWSYDIILNLYDFVFRGDYGSHNWTLMSMHQFYAEFIQEAKPDEAVEALSKAFAHAKACDELANGDGDITYSSPLMNRVKHPRKYLTPSAARELLKFLTEDVFGTGRLRHKPLHENAEFIALVKEAEAWVAERG